MGPPGGLQEFNFIVPTGKTGLIIGKGNTFYLFSKMTLFHMVSLSLDFLLTFTA